MVVVGTQWMAEDEIGNTRVTISTLMIEEKEMKEKSRLTPWFSLVS